ncbi:branched-chain amino acid ABC transporter permease [Enterococcus faecium]|uniref:ABC transporter permease n=1 Tax=Enterococcus TaxID=1350 RepID=UPI000CF288D1|nr:MULTISPECIES: ABC transporter permease [Enterococcus]MBL4993953.1 branched-chain amino acid ABC transporter permease [Enterococcus lactis]MBL4997913.1 branched-chain amino acid ABC transporter permease [Enterococcus lactis]MBL4999056.1 branched-chain amino acid ABC transporter permease [Enterococcus lactis]PQF05365.1 branched-chain amino acid ABC transporter permease [Enterococcus faecium]PQF28572.1 branched-chain amino acid ABC transporter permease [Enterococcus faecium]
MIVSAISQGMLWAILGLGIFMTYRILDFPDMTTEGSFPLGAAVCVTAITHGVAPILATLLGVGAGMVAGLITGLLYTKGKIPVILAGILVMSGLNSVILFVMRTPNLSLLNYPILQDSFHRFGLPDYFDTVLLGFISLGILIAVLLFFFNTDLGQGYIATGDNETMARSLGIKTDRMKILGLTLSNGVIALSGALIAQNDGYADVNKGIGVIVIGLASIIIGEVIFQELTLAERLIAIVVGSIIYQLLILVVIKLGFDTTYLKLFSAIILAICLMIPQLKKALNLKTGFEKEA